MQAMAFHINSYAPPILHSPAFLPPISTNTNPFTAFSSLRKQIGGLKASQWQRRRNNVQNIQAITSSLPDGMDPSPFQNMQLSIVSSIHKTYVTIHSNFLLRPSSSSSSSSQLFSSLLGFLWREIYISYRFVHYDLAVTVVPGLLVAFATHLKAKLLHTHNLSPLWISLATSLLINWLYIYVFTLANQIVGVTEDMVNKPTRPIPSGLVTTEGAFVRLVLATLFFLIVSYSFHVGSYMAVWAVFTFLHNFSSLFTGWWHWLMKPVVMGVGIFVSVGGNTEIVRHMNSNDVLYAGVVSLVIVVGSSLQDLRDVEGDRGQRRRTLPLLLGGHLARMVCVLMSISMWVIMHIYITYVAGTQLKASITSAIIGIWCLLLCYRMMYLREAKADHDTYMILVYLWCFLAVVPLWIP